MADAKDRSAAARSNLLAGLPGDIAEAIIARSTKLSYDRGTTLFVQGEPATAIYVVLEGWVKLFRIASNGAEAIVACFTTGQSFGEAVVLQGGRYPVTAEAVTECRLMLVRPAVIFEMMERRPEVMRSMLASMYVHLHSLVSQIEQLKARTGAQRVAEFLLELCPGDSGSCTVRLPYDKALIAGRLGMKPESLSRAFGRLRQEGVAIQQNRAAIADIERLRSYAEDGHEGTWSEAR